MMRSFERWICTRSGQTACVVVFVIAVVAYIGVLVFENKWGD